MDKKMYDERKFCAKVGCVWKKKLGVLKAIFSDFWGKKLYSCQSQKEIRVCKCLKISGLKE